MSAWHKLLLLQLDFEFSIMHYHLKIVYFKITLVGKEMYAVYLWKVF